MKRPQKSAKAKILLLICIIVIIVAIGIIIKNNQKEEIKEEINNSIEQEKQNTEILEFVEEKDGEKYNSSKKLNSDKEYKGLRITNVKLSEQDKGSSVLLLADVVNKSNTNKKEEHIKLKFVDKDQKEIATVQAVVPPIKAGDKAKLNTKLLDPKFATQIVNAYDFIVEK